MDKRGENQAAEMQRKKRESFDHFSRFARRNEIKEFQLYSKGAGGLI